MTNDKQQEWSRDGTAVASSNNDGTVCLHRLGQGGSRLEEVARVRGGGVHSGNAFMLVGMSSSMQD